MMQKGSIDKKKIVEYSIKERRHGDDGKTWALRRVGVSRGRVDNGIYRDPPHQSINTEATYNHIGEDGLPSCL